MRITLFWCLFVLFFSISCSSDEEKRAEFAQLVEKKDAQTLLDDLYLASDGDIVALGRILNASPSSISRIRKGETMPTYKFEERIKEVSVFYVQNDKSFSKLRSVLDDEYGWYDAVLDFPGHYLWWFLGGNLVLLVIFIFSKNKNVIVVVRRGKKENIHSEITEKSLGFKIVGGIFAGQVVLFLVVWLCSLIFSPSKEITDDKYLNTIDPAIEQVL